MKMHPKTYFFWNFFIKAFILTFVIFLSILIVYYSTIVIDWTAFSKVLDDAVLLWTCLILGVGILCGIVFMWLFYSPDSAWIVSRLDNPGAMSYIFILMTVKIKMLGWSKHFEDIDFNFIRGKLDKGDLK